MSDHPEPLVRRARTDRDGNTRAQRGNTRFGSPRQPVDVVGAIIDRIPALGSPVMRRFMRRRLFAVIVAAAVGLGVFSAVSDAQRTTTALGETAQVLVVARPVAAGELLDASVLHVEPRPRSLVPGGAMSGLDDLGEGARAKVSLTEGEVLVAGRVSTASATATAAVLAPGTAAIALPVDPTTTPLGPGDVIDVFAAVPALDFEVGRVATGAVVLEAGSDRAVVAVHASDVRQTATAVLGGPVSVVVLPASGPGDGDVVDDE